MNYVEFRFFPIALEEEKDILMARLAELGFESFAGEDDRLIAYLPVNQFDDDLDDDIDALLTDFEIHREYEFIEDKNWNEEWEKNYEPVVISGKCRVRAPFHPPIPEIPYEIIIEPKMAFGTAHHETTQLMAGWLLDMDVSGKSVLDMGCGTGILAILANKMGAGNVIGIDNDEWAWRNAKENFSLNDVRDGEVILGDAAHVGENRFDLILANINRNILVRDIDLYVKGLKAKGQIVMSGFYESDVDAIRMASRDAGLEYAGVRILNQWAAMLFIKANA